MKKLYTVSRNKPEPTVAEIMLIAKFRLKLKKLGKTTRPFRYESESCSVVSDSLQPHGLCTPWNSPGQNTGQIAFPFSRGFSQPRDWTQVFRIAGGFFTSWATRDAQEYWSGYWRRLSLLQQIFQTQELNEGLLRCRQILYQLSYQGSPSIHVGPKLTPLP